MDLGSVRTDQGRSFVPGDGCSQSGDQQEARKTCIAGSLIIKLATEINNSFMSDDISINIETPMSLRTIVERIPIGLDVYAESSDPLKDTWENFVLPHVNKEDLDHYKTLWNTIVRKGPSIKPQL